MLDRFGKMASYIWILCETVKMEQLYVLMLTILCILKSKMVHRQEYGANNLFSLKQQSHVNTSIATISEAINIQRYCISSISLIRNGCRNII